MRIAYVNGRYVPHLEARVHIEDRGYQFSDGVYEVIAFFNGRMLDREGHIERLKHSLEALHIDLPMAWGAFNHVMWETIRRNGLKEGIIYMQVTRGVARRDHPFPKEKVKPALVMTVGRPRWPSAEMVEKGIKVITVPDRRWQRRDIKSISLLPNILAKQEAMEAGAKEAWQVLENDVVTEGASTNAYIVTGEGKLVTHPADETILGGITRDTLLRLAKKAGIAVEERPFTKAEACQAAEAFLTSTTMKVMPIVQIDETVIGNGKPGPIALKLLSLYDDYIREQTS